VLGGEPWVFRNQPNEYRRLKEHLAAQLGCSEEHIAIVGSAKIGFSLSPDTFGRPFLETSDVDVVVANERLFDELWALLLDWQYPWHLRKWPQGEQGWGLEWLEGFIAGWCQPTNILFGGVVRPRSYPPIRDFSRRWFDAFKSTATHPELAGRDFQGRLYRSWEHAIRYQVSGLNEVLRQAPSKKRRP
jgi:hypothetical protein